MIARTLYSATESIPVVSLFSVCVCVCARPRTCVRARAAYVQGACVCVCVCVCVGGWVGGCGCCSSSFDRCDLM